MGTTKITFGGPDIPPGMNHLIGMNKHKKTALIEKYAWLIKRKGYHKHPGRVRVHLEFKSVQYMDWDNLLSTCKLVFDAMVRIGCLVDDSPKYMECPTMTQERQNNRKIRFWTITITDIE